MEIGKVKILGLAIILLLSGAIIPTLAYMYFWQTDPIVITSGVVLNQYPTPTMGIGVYWDAECTQPVTVIDFGEMVHPKNAVWLSAFIYIRNEGNSWHRIRWNSTLSSITTEFTEQWKVVGGPSGTGNLWNYYLDPSDVCRTVYEINVPAYATVGTYNWTLNLWAVHYY